MQEHFHYEDTGKQRDILYTEKIYLHSISRWWFFIIMDQNLGNAELTVLLAC